MLMLVLANKQMVIYYNIAGIYTSKNLKWLLIQFVVLDSKTGFNPKGAWIIEAWVFNVCTYAHKLE